MPFLAIIVSKIVFKKFLGLSNLFATQIVDINIFAKIVIINKDQKLKFVVFKIIIISFKGFNCYQEFLIMSFVLSFCWEHFSKEKNSSVLLPKIKSQLIKDITYSISKNIGFNLNITF